MVGDSLGRRIGYVALLGACWAMPMHAFPGQAAEGLPTANELKKMSLEELMDIEVTLVSKRAESIGGIASPIQVITGEDIRRSGASTLAEALRLASNLQVARIDARQWAVTARGFNNILTNKLLVMIDGRTVYTPLYAGVFWDAQHMLLDNVERIEVVSGPGGTLWGSNAVNGVINIVTKHSASTQGGLIAGGAGTFLEDFGALRYGGQAAGKLSYRVSGQRLDHGAAEFRNGRDGENAWDFTQAGFRMDWAPGAKDEVMATGNLYGGHYGYRRPEDSSMTGGHILGRWTRTSGAGSETQAQVYFDQAGRFIPGAFRQEVRTYDLDLHHRLPLGSRHSVLLGMGYRLMDDDVANSWQFAFLPARKDLHLFNAYLQDEIAILETLRFTVGSKIEHNGYTGFEGMPSARLAWTPWENGTFWGGLSRAVRSPSRYDRELFVPSPPVDETILKVAGGPDFGSEYVDAYELGMRLRPFARLSVSVSAFHNRYGDLRIYDSSLTAVKTLYITNGAEGEVSGVEVFSGFQAAAWWQMRGGYTYLLEEFRIKPGHLPYPIPPDQGDDPDHQFMLQSMMDLPGNFELNGVARFAGELEAYGVPDYFTYDLGVVWAFRGLEVSVYGKDLAKSRHPEFGPETGSTYRQYFPRSVIGAAQWRF